MNTNDKWNLIVEHFQNNQNEIENILQKEWENIFSDSNIFGYSRISGEVCRQYIQIGSREREITDITIKDSINNKNLFNVELKQYNMLFDEKFEKQLFSYLKALELKIGILICNKIYIYWREYQNSESYRLEIPFEKDNSDGIEFVELFSKNNFNSQKIKEFIKNKYDFVEHTKIIEKEIKTIDIKNLIKEHYKNDYTQQEIDFALRNIEIKIDFPKINNIKREVRVRSYNNKHIQTSSISKHQAIEKFRDLGYNINNDVTFSTKNNGKTTTTYWANPNISKLHKDHWIILNDNINKELFLFYIPADNIKEEQLTLRNDKQNLIDLQIEYNDPTFTDKRSKYEFAKFFKEKIDY